MFLVLVAGAAAWGIHLFQSVGKEPMGAGETADDEVGRAQQLAFDKKYVDVGSRLAAALTSQGVTQEDIAGWSAQMREDGTVEWQLERIDLDVTGEPEKLATAVGEQLREVPGARYSLNATGDDRMLLEVVLDDRVTHHFLIETLRPSGSPRMAIIIDDIGYKKAEALELMRLDAALTFAVLPGGPYSRDLASQAARRRREVLLHLPLEPDTDLEGVFPEDILKVDLPKAELKARLRDALTQVPQAVGVNNHMGSRFTQDPEAMRTLLTELADRELFFVDSRTTPDTVGVEVARNLGLASAQRDIFLDDDQQYETTINQLEAARRLALERGHVVVIGHPYESTVQALRDTLPRLQAEGIEIVGVSDLVTAPLVLGEGAQSPGP